MGHTLAQWRAKVAAILRDNVGLDTRLPSIDDDGLRPAFSEHSRRRPYDAVAEVAGSGATSFALPQGWIADWSELWAVEYPARRDPAVLLDAGAWRVGPSTTDVTVRKIFLDRSPAAGEWVRFYFTGAWPFPDATSTTDQIQDVHFEAVATLAASKLLLSLASSSARNRDGAIPSDVVDGRQRTADLRAIAADLRSEYERVCPAFVVLA